MYQRTKLAFVIACCQLSLVSYYSGTGSNDTLPGNLISGPLLTLYHLSLQIPTFTIVVPIKHAKVTPYCKPYLLDSWGLG